MRGWRIAAVSLFLLACFGFGAYLSAGVWQKARAEQKASQIEEAKRAAAERTKADLVRQKAELESESGQERLAREHGEIRPGEKPL